MRHIKILDCTLRDGGYCNQWKFGYENSRKITAALVESGIDIIECGFISNSIQYDLDVTKFDTVERVSDIFPADRKGKCFVAMMNYGEFLQDDIPEYRDGLIDGIRMAFHKKDMEKALAMCKEIKDKGYKVFIQAMVSLNYTDDEFLDLIRRVNEFSPYAFYIVDSFGMMKGKDLTRLFYMIEHNLKDDILIGFHSHNNMQLAYSNAQILVSIQTNKGLIIDASVYGMGRGAGNLNTELFTEYLNDTEGTNYSLSPLLSIIDQILDKFYNENYWGYTLPNYLSAKYNTHPNYAGYLNKKNTLTVENMDEIFSIMDSNKRNSYDESYIEELYEKYMEQGASQNDRDNIIQNAISGKEVLIIASGRTSLTEFHKVKASAGESDTISISVNFEYPFLKTDYIFVSNLRRYRELDDKSKPRCIVTSNIPSIDVFLKVNYKELTNNCDVVRDNSGLMLMKLMILLGAKKLKIAGMDGYAVDKKNNYMNEQMEFYMEKTVLEMRNSGIVTVMKEYSKEIEIEFVTTPQYIMIGD